jgi:hypothetical protein
LASALLDDIAFVKSAGLGKNNHGQRARIYIPKEFLCKNTITHRTGLYATLEHSKKISFSGETY